MLWIQRICNNGVKQKIHLEPVLMNLLILMRIRILDPHWKKINADPELKTLEWWISGLMLNPLFFLISRLNMAYFPLEFNLQISQQIGIKDIPF